MEKRNASDVLLALESKIDHLVKIVQNQDLIIKVLANKHNEILRKLDNLSKPTISAPLPPQQFVSPPQAPQDNVPVYRRGSREAFPETVVPKHVMEALQKPTDIKPAEVIVPKPITVPTDPSPDDFPEEPIVQKFPVTQKVVSGEKKKPVYPAGIEIFNEANALMLKCKTNSVGKWMAQLPVGKYKVTVTALLVDSAKPKNATQFISIDGLQSPLVLPEIIVT